MVRPPVIRTVPSARRVAVWLDLAVVRWPAAPGTVVNELRRGYTWKGRLIRCAEVQAVRGIASVTSQVDDPDTAESEEELDEVGARVRSL